MTADFDLKALYTAIDDQRENRGMTWAGVTKEIGISTSTIKGTKERTNVEGDGVIRMLSWLDRAPESFVPGYSGKFEPLVPASGNKVLRWDTAAIHDAVNRKREATKQTWSEVAEQVGMAPQQLKHMAKGGRTGIRTVMRIAAWLGVSASSLTKESAY